MTNNTRTIPLSQGLHATVDAADYDALAQFTWCVVKGARNVYAARRVRLFPGPKGQGTIIMHREIMKPPAGMLVDHIDHDGLNNTRANMRICTHAENMRNSRSRSGSSSQYLGVKHEGDRPKWGAYISINGKQTRLGRFDTELEAAIVYDTAARLHYGAFANPNFPD